MVRKIISDETIEEPEKLIKKKKIRTEVIEESEICAICGTDIKFTITNRYVDGKLTKSDKKEVDWPHNPLECLRYADRDFVFKEDIEMCGNCYHWAGKWDSCGDIYDQFCSLYNRQMTKEEYDWILRVFPEKLKKYGGVTISFEETQHWSRQLKFTCYEYQWCEKYKKGKN